MRGKSLHVRLDGLTIRQVDELAAVMGARKSAVVSRAVDRMWCVMVGSREKKEVQGEREAKVV